MNSVSTTLCGKLVKFVLTINLLIFVLSIFNGTYIQCCSVRKYHPIWLLKQIIQEIICNVISTDTVV